MGPGVITADLHGKNAYQAKVTVEALLRRADRATYRLRLMAGSRNWYSESFNSW